MKVGYARVSSKDQNLDRQIAALNEAGVERIFADKQSGKDFERVEYKAMMKRLRADDVIADEIMRRSLTIRASNRERRSVWIALRRHHACGVDDDPFNSFAGVAATPFFDASVTPPRQTVRYVDVRSFHYVHLE